MSLPPESSLPAEAEPEAAETVICPVNADQLFGLVTPADYDQSTQGTVRVKFDSDCAQSLRCSPADAQAEQSICMIGLTGPSVRKRTDEKLLPFSIPYKRFLEVKRKADDSFLSKEIWRCISGRISQ